MLACFRNFTCYNDGVCDGDTCHCSQENGITKYHGKNCHMPGNNPCAGNPCQNGGNCTSFTKAKSKNLVSFLYLLGIFCYFLVFFHVDFN